MTIHALVPQCTLPRQRCFELFRIQNSHSFHGLRQWIHWGGLTAHFPQTPWLHNSFSPRNVRRKTGTPIKLLDTALAADANFNATRITS